MNNSITRERLEKIKSWRETYGAGSNVMLPAEEAEELARMALAAMDSEPVILYRQVNPVNGMKTYWAELDPEEFRHLKKYTDENAEFMTLYRHAQPAPASPVCTCPSGDGSLRWPCPVHAGNSLVIPDGSASMLRRWLAFGRAMQNAGCQLPHNLIAETEAMLAAATQEAINALIPLVSRNEQEGK
ncbi:TPA: hypothetical protein R4X77_001156 [Klebsiella pneumoniae]|uniref:hypothetical protein n=1 Tax=Klebsiella pneumoniae TaxID=573 RepID=UPI000E2B15C0|nr:hypothetical protein [Klebsiella pneumoniae]WQO21171.1 hypothetical protein U0545_18405 [Klebsiella pneumoniae subsp. pneumoniae]SWM01456.1 Uncharacterised protein [Klebsiella pneumoniae]HED2224658.1 hypothetical protein [Klebsiella pneumoniae]HED2246668.1 hypothetical protein [Klebsiella pneumoniae]HED2862986.1 hypothetical protein [Klebsiella pneumoniae]